MKARTPSVSIVMPTGGLIEREEWRRNTHAWVSLRYQLMLPAAEFVEAESTQEPYNRAEARNRAVAKSTGDILFIVDADTVFNIGQIVRGISRVQEGASPWVIPYTTYFNMTQGATVYLCENHEPTQDIDEPVYDPDGPPLWEHRIEDSPAGGWIVPREAYELVGGFDERFGVAWGGDDDAFVLALDTLYGKHGRGPGAALHLWHPRAGLDFEDPLWKSHNAPLLRRYKIAAGRRPQMQRLINERQS